MSSSEQQPNKGLEGLPIPGLVQSQEQVEQLAFADHTPVLASGPQPDQQHVLEELADRETAPRPISQAGFEQTFQKEPVSQMGFEQTQQLRPISQMGFEQSFQGGPASQSGLEQTRQLRPISQAGLSSGGPGSQPGLADLDTTRQPAVHATGTAQPISQPGLAAPISSAGQQPFPEQLLFPGQPISQPGLASGNVAAGQPISQPGLGNGSLALQPISQSGWGTGELSGAGSTRALLMNLQPELTQALASRPRPDPHTTAARPPVVIRSERKGEKHSIRPPQGRRHVVTIAALLLLLVITGGTLLLTSPLGLSVKVSLGIATAPSQIHKQGSSGAMSLVAQATATAVVHQQNDGYVPGVGGGAILTGSPETWPLGVCTYWANLRYHELTGTWVTWLGNAYQWVDGARQAGWHVSTSPHVPSIIVLMPGVQGASGYGHVAVVEDANGDSVSTSNMNWYADGGGWDIKSYYTFTAGPGVYFIWSD